MLFSRLQPVIYTHEKTNLVNDLIQNLTIALKDIINIKNHLSYIVMGAFYWWSVQIMVDLALTFVITGYLLVVNDTKQPLHIAVKTLCFGRKEENVLLNDALNTFYLLQWRRTYGTGTPQWVREETRCRHLGYSFRLTTRVLLYAPSYRQDSTYHGLCYTSRGSLVGTRNILSVGWCI